METHPSPSTPPSSKRCGQLATASDNRVVLWVLVVAVMVVVMVVVVMAVLVVIVVMRVGHWLTKLKMVSNRALDERLNDNRQGWQGQDNDTCTS